MNPGPGLLVRRDIADELGGERDWVPVGPDRRAATPASLEQSGLSSLGWLSLLSRADLNEFFRELGSANEESSVEIVRAWHATAISLADDLSRSILLGELEWDQLVEAPRPTDAE